MIAFAQYSDVPINHGFRTLICRASELGTTELPLCYSGGAAFPASVRVWVCRRKARFVPAIQLAARIEDCFADLEERWPDPHATPVAKSPFAYLSAIASDDFFRGEVVRVRHGGYVSRVVQRLVAPATPSDRDVRRMPAPSPRTSHRDPKLRAQAMMSALRLLPAVSGDAAVSQKPPSLARVSDAGPMLHYFFERSCARLGLCAGNAEDALPAIAVEALKPPPRQSGARRAQLSNTCQRICDAD